MRHILLAILFGLTACTTVARPNTAPTRDATPAIPIPDHEATSRLDAIIREHRIITAGVGILRNGELVWSHYAGEELPGVTPSAQTR